jgi:hypothetical protein
VLGRREYDRLYVCASSKVQNVGAWRDVELEVVREQRVMMSTALVGQWHVRFLATEPEIPHHRARNPQHYVGPDTFDACASE